MLKQIGIKVLGEKRFKEIYEEYLQTNFFEMSCCH